MSNCIVVNATKIRNNSIIMIKYKTNVFLKVFVDIRNDVICHAIGSLTLKSLHIFCSFIV